MKPHNNSKTQKRQEAPTDTIQGSTFVREVTRAKHFVYKHGGYGLMYQTMDNLRGKGVEEVKIVERDTGTEYSCTLSEFFENSTLDFLGHYGLQYFIPVETMSEVLPLVYQSRAVVGKIETFGIGERKRNKKVLRQRRFW